MKKAFSIRESIKTAWQLISNDNLFLLIGLILGYLVVYGLLSTVQVVNQGGISSALANLLNVFVSIVFSMGFIKVCLQIAKGEEPEFKAFKDVIPLFFRYFFASILSALPAIGCIIVAAIVAFVVGDFAHSTLKLTPEVFKSPILLEQFLSTKASSIFLFFVISVVPIVYFKIRWLFYPYYIIDKNAKIVDSLRQSWYATKGHFWHLFLLSLAFVGLMILGFIALILGIFVAIPLVAMVTTLVYLQLDKARQPKEVIEPVQSEIQQ